MVWWGNLSHGFGFVGDFICLFRGCTERLALDPDCPSARETHAAKDEFGESSRLLLEPWKSTATVRWK